jgi:hypothetical protein
MWSWIISVTTFNRRTHGIIGKNDRKINLLNLLTGAFHDESKSGETIKVDIIPKGNQPKPDNEWLMSSRNTENLFRWKEEWFRHRNCRAFSLMLQFCGSIAVENWNVCTCVPFWFRIQLLDSRWANKRFRHCDLNVLESSFGLSWMSASGIAWPLFHG